MHLTLHPITRLSIVLGLAVLFAAGPAAAQPTFTKAFEPATIGPGSASLLTFTIDNTSGGAVIDLVFTDNLPADVFLADPAVPTTDCPDATLSAPDGGSTITFSDGELAGGAICTVEVLVTSSTVATHMNVSGDLTSSAGNSGNATADLAVDSGLPGFSKSFSPSSVPLGSRGILTFTIDNTANASNVGNLDFTDNLPTGLVVADPANASTDCVSTGAPNTTLTANPGTSVVTLDANGSTFSGFEVLAAGASCSVSVDVVPEGMGSLDNVSGDLVADFTAAGRAVDTLESTAGDIVLIKEFLADPVPPGGTVDLEFTILNRTRSDDATNVEFTDDLDATLSGLVATGLPTSVCGGTVSGTSTLTFTGGFVAAAGECSFTVTLQVPAGATQAVYPNTTTNVQADFGFGEPTFGNQASDDLFVLAVPIFTKEFIDDPTTGGGTVTLRFTITNTDAASGLTDIEFTDDLGAVIPGLAANGLVSGQADDPRPDVCGTGSELTVFDPPDIGPIVTPADPTQLVFTGGNLAAAGMPGDSCTFDVVLDVPAGTSSGSYTNTTSELRATPLGTGPASDDLVVVAAPQLTKEFTDDRVSPGGTVTLSFTLFHPAEATSDATGIAFTDDLDATLTGLTSIGGTQTGVCGAGSEISGTSFLSFTGGTLAPGDTCTFTVTLQVPVGATPGAYTNTTSDVTATVSGLAATGLAATDDLLVTGLSFSKQFVDDPVIAGDTSILRFTLRNDGSANATSLSFSDNLDAALSGLTAVGLPVSNVCGSGSSISGSSSLLFAGGNLLAGTFCTFDVTVQVPAAATDGRYPNLTSALSATEGGVGVTIPPAADGLDVLSTLLQLSKEFVGDPVQAGDVLTMELEITNQSAIETVSSIALTDDLDAALTGLTATGIVSDGCGFGGTSLGSTLSLSGAGLAPSASCLVEVEVQVPAGAPAGLYTNTTSDATGDVGGLTVTGLAATDDLRVTDVAFTKSFDGPSVAGGAPVLTFTLRNLDASNGATGLAFTDDLDAVLAGLTATSLPSGDVCGSGSSVSGTSLLAFLGGSLEPAGSSGDSCTFSVTLDVPVGAAPGVYPNTTSDLTSAGIVVNAPATADLVIEPPPGFAKSFSPDSVGLGIASTLTFAIDNSASAVGATGLDFTDSLPAGLEVAPAPNASTTCAGGTIGATAGSGTITYGGGSVGAGATCIVEVDVVPTTSGSLMNVTGDLTSSSGNSGTATDNLVANPQPGFGKVFAPDLIPVGGTSTLTFTIDNTSSTVDATGLDFTDSLPTGVEVAPTPNASATCTGGTLAATAGSGTLSYSGGTVVASATCTVSADVTATSAGSFENLSGDLTSSLGNSGDAADTLEAVEVDLVLAKSFVSNPVLAGGTVEVEYTVTNPSAFTATSISFTDDYDGALTGLQATGLPVADVCGAGSQIGGASVLSLTDGNLAPSSSCTFTVSLVVPGSAAAGTYPGTTSQMDALVDGVAVVAPPASDALVVANIVFDKDFAGTAEPGGSIVLTFSLENPDPVNAATGLSFTDDLDAFLLGAVATDLPKNDVCGAGSQLSGASLITLMGGTLAGGSSCTFDVEILIPEGVVGTFFNVTSSLEGEVGASSVSLDPAGAQAELTVEGTVLEIPVLDPWSSTLLALLLAFAGLRAVRPG